MRNLIKIHCSVQMLGCLDLPEHISVVDILDERKLEHDPISLILESHHFKPVEVGLGKPPVPLHKCEISTQPKKVFKFTKVEG